MARRPLRLALQRGHALRYFRHDVKRWTQTHLARVAGVSANSIGRLEARGVRSPVIYLKLRRALGVSEADVEAWIAARPIDRRLLPLVAWFDTLPAKDRDVLAHALMILLRRTMTLLPLVVRWPLLLHWHLAYHLTS